MDGLQLLKKIFHTFVCWFLFFFSHLSLILSRVVFLISLISTLVLSCDHVHLPSLLLLHPAPAIGITKGRQKKKIMEFSIIEGRYENGNLFINFFFYCKWSKMLLKWRNFFDPPPRHIFGLFSGFDKEKKNFNWKMHIL